MYVCHRQTRRVPNAVPVSLRVHSAFGSSLIKHPTYLSDPCHYVYTVLSDHLSSSTPLAFRTFFTCTLLPGSSALLQTRTILPYKVQWSALFSSPGSNYLEPAVCFCPLCYLCVIISETKITLLDYPRRPHPPTPSPPGIGQCKSESKTATRSSF